MRSRASLRTMRRPGIRRDGVRRRHGGLRDHQSRRARSGWELDADGCGRWRLRGGGRRRFRSVEEGGHFEERRDHAADRRRTRRSPVPAPVPDVESRVLPRPRNELFDSPPRTGAHVDIDLGGGLKARVPTALSEAEAVDDLKRSSQLAALHAALAGVADSGDPPDLDARLTDVVVAWNVFRHFYPYWPEAGVDWDARLRPQLAPAHDATTRNAHRDAMRLLVADARDGHGSVVDPRGKGEVRCPFGWRGRRSGSSSRRPPYPRRSPSVRSWRQSTACPPRNDWPR